MQPPTDTHYQALCHAKCLDGIRTIRSYMGKSVAEYSSSLFGFELGLMSNTRHSITKYLLLFGRSPISWKSKKQTIVSRSFSEAEYRAIASAPSEITWTVCLLEKLGVCDLKPATLHCDNQYALNIVTTHLSAYCQPVGQRLHQDSSFCSFSDIAL